MKKIYYLFTASVIIAISLILPKAAEAATLSFSTEPQQIYVGDVFVVSINLDSANAKINVAQAVIHFDTNMLEVKNISTGGSIFSQWANGPVYDNQVGVISFTGGTTGNFSGSSGNILTIAFYAKQKGQTTLKFAADSALYLADGKGTQTAPHLTDGQITISDQTQNNPPTNKWTNILANDKTPPENLNITLGKDSSVFGGQYFVSFSATDSESGVDYYAVSEDDGAFVQTQSPYVLKDQTLSGTITVKAVDKAGNASIKSLNLKRKNSASIGYRIWLIIACLAVLLIAALVIKKLKKM